MNDSKSAGNPSLENQVTYECSYIPNFSWNDDFVSPIATYVVSCVACPLTIVLNMLIIVVVVKKKTLQSNYNILLCNMAVTDLLVGAVVQPLAIVSWAFFFQGHGVHCTIETINTVILVGTCTCSVYHLTAIAWQRYVRTSLDLINNPTNVSRRRIKVLIFVAWLTALISTIPSVMVVKGVYLQYSVYLDSLVFVTIVICWILVVYYYVSIYVKTRKINFHPSDQTVSQAAKAKMERRIALTSGLLTLMVFLFYSPNLVFVLCYVNPIFCKSSYLLWALTLITLNSLANPILYCYRNRQLRQAALELLGRETWEMPVVLPLERKNRTQSNNLPIQDPQRPALPQGSRARERSKSWGPNNFNNINLAAQRRPSVVWSVSLVNGPE